MSEYPRFYDNIRARLVNTINNGDVQSLTSEIDFCMQWGEPLSSMGSIAQAALDRMQLVDEKPRLINKKATANHRADGHGKGKAAPVSSPPPVTGGWVPR